MKKLLVLLFCLFNILPTAIAKPDGGLTVMILGDSLSTGYGLPADASWVNLLKQRMQALSPRYQVVNISISGETTLGGRNRIEQAIKTHHPDIVIIGLGGNDGLRGASIKSIHDNLEAIIQTCQQYHATPILAGMQLPPNYGIAYTQKFRNIYTDLAERYQLKLIPFLLAGFGDKREYFLADGIHPDIPAQKIITENVWDVLHTMLESGFSSAKGTIQTVPTYNN
ncbi:arylesterase [Nitrosomonas sp.]|uniref:arylesterase n=1 Tax=Nitrosomonas sp. TaxID=42353 RepID=UPI002620CC08|nr:arylesterase [Nitrosomonas sp.]MCW5598975.1 arylesterase [Nitrosomonas sp.]MCW5601441.1 arylesterase [Nitrosomonas sp.]